PEQNLRAKAAVPDVTSGLFRSIPSAQQLRKRTMKDKQTTIAGERQFITKEFADTIAGKTPPPYLRLRDPVQKALIEDVDQYPLMLNRKRAFGSSLLLKARERWDRDAPKCWQIMPFYRPDGEPEWWVIEHLKTVTGRFYDTRKEAFRVAYEQ